MITALVFLWVFGLYLVAERAAQINSERAFPRQVVQESAPRALAAPRAGPFAVLGELLDSGWRPDPNFDGDYTSGTIGKLSSPNLAVPRRWTGPRSRGVSHWWWHREGWRYSKRGHKFGMLMFGDTFIAGTQTEPTIDPTGMELENCSEVDW